MFVEEISKEVVLLKLWLRHVTCLIRIEKRLVLVVLVLVVVVLVVWVFALFRFCPSAWERHLLEEVSTSPTTFDNKFNALSSAKEVLCLSEDQNVLLWDNVHFALVSDVAHSLLTVIEVYYTMLDAFTFGWSFLVLDWISVDVSDVASADALLVEVALEANLDIFVDSEHFVLTHEVSAVKVDVAFSVSRLRSKFWGQFRRLDPARSLGPAERLHGALEVVREDLSLVRVLVIGDFLRGDYDRVSVLIVDVDRVEAVSVPSELESDFRLFKDAGRSQFRVDRFNIRVDVVPPHSVLLQVFLGLDEKIAVESEFLDRAGEHFVFKVFACVVDLKESTVLAGDFAGSKTAVVFVELEFNLGSSSEAGWEVSCHNVLTGDVNVLGQEPAFIAIFVRLNPSKASAEEVVLHDPLVLDSLCHFTALEVVRLSLLLKVGERLSSEVADVDGTLPCGVV